MLPIDDGRAPNERWPWKRSDDFSPGKVLWVRGVSTTLVIVAIGAAAGLIIGANAGFYLIAFLVGLVAGAVAAAPRVQQSEWPEWRVRNLIAADHRANCSLAEVDPDLAAELGYGRPEPDGQQIPPPPKAFRGGRAPTTGDFNPTGSDFDSWPRWPGGF